MKTKTKIVIIVALVLIIAIYIASASALSIGKVSLGTKIITSTKMSKGNNSDIIEKVRTQILEAGIK